MAKYQLWLRDEYGQGSILFTSEDIDEVVKRGKQEVTRINVENALTADDRERNWEAYMVQINSESQKGTKYVYGGPHAKATDTIYAFGKKKEETVKLGDIPKSVVRIYLGNISVNRNEEKDWLATDPNKRIIETIDHQELQNKTMLFIKKV